MSGEGQEDERQGWVRLQPGLWIPGSAVRREIAKHCAIPERQRTEPNAERRTEPNSLGNETNTRQQ
jgi:hypothetical protein